MLGLRRDVSFLLERGHSQARRYPIIMLWNEAEIGRDRKRRDLTALALVMQGVAAATSPNHTKKTGKEATEALNQLIKDIENGRII